MTTETGGMVAWVLDRMASWGYPGVTIAMGLDAACLPLPSELIMTYAGYLAHSDPAEYSAWRMGVAGALGCVLGSTPLYWAGRLGGRRFVERYGKYLLISEKDLARTEHWFGRYGEAAVCFARVVPMLRTVISVPAGVGRLCFGKFLAYTLLGSLPWCVGLAYIGDAFGDQWKTVTASLAPVADVAALATVAAVAGVHLWRVARRRSAHAQ